MRVISQDGATDVPYERYTVCGYKDEHRNVYHIVCDYSETSYRRLADYSTEAKAIKAMEMLRTAYENNAFYHCVANSKRFEEMIVSLDDEKFTEITTEYFKFPQDDEIEV